MTAADESTGAYELVVATSSDIGDTPDTAFTLTVPPDGTATIDSVIEPGGDKDLFRVVAPLSGTLTVWQRANGTSPDQVRLDSYLTVFDADMVQIAADDDSGLNRDAQLSFSVIEGKTYYIQAGGYEGDSPAPVRTRSP